MLYLLIATLGILLTIFFVIGTHESAHFLTARLLGVKVLRFSIGFGKTLFYWHDKSGTEYVFALIPLGGYVKMLDEREGNVPAKELHRAFNRQPYYKKCLIVAAGPLINIFCAFVLYWLIFVIGFVTIKPVIGTITPDSIAAKSGLRARQEIIQVDQHDTKTWASIAMRILAHTGNQDTLTMTVKGPAKQPIKNVSLNLHQWQLDKLSPEPLQSLGIKPYQPEVPLIIGVISSDSPAANSPLKLGDKIIAINKKPVKDWQRIINTIMEHPNQTLHFTIERQTKKMTLAVAVGSQRNLLFQQYGYLGIGPRVQWPSHMQHTIQYGFLEAIPQAWEEMVNFTYFNFMVIGKLLTGKISLQSLAGPITIFETAGAALNYGFLPFIGFLAFLSIAIGIINILPIPGLDGGHLLIQTIEVIIRRPVPENVLLLIYRLGFILIFLVLIQAVINDVVRLSS